MPTDYRRVADFLKIAIDGRNPEQLARFLPRHDPAGPRVPGGGLVAPADIDARWQLPGLPGAAREQLLDDRSSAEASVYERNIEHFIGTVRVPVGLIGPLRVNGLFAHGDYYVPLATTEAALVASYSRGARLLLDAGGCTTLVVNEGVTRAPGFAFETSVDAALFVAWTTTQLEAFRAAAAQTTKVRPAHRFADYARGQPRVPRLRVLHGRCRRPEYGDDRHRSDLPPHRHAHTHQAPLPLRRGEPVRRQEGHVVLVHVGPRPQSHRRSPTVARDRREAAPYDNESAHRLLADVGARRGHERQHRRPGTLCQRPRRPLHRLRSGRGMRGRSRGRRHAGSSRSTMAGCMRR